MEQIPRKIHAAWFGSRLPDDIRTRFDRWRELNPGYELKLWTESNSPLHIPYLRNTLAEKYWSNASNFIRLWSVYQEGGIYLDCDVDLLYPLDALLEDACFLGFEATLLELDDVVNTAVLGAVPHHEFVLSCLRTLLAEFHGTEDSNLSGPGLATRVCRDYGLDSYGEQCLLRGRVRIYEKEIFYPISFEDSKDTQAEIPPSSVAVHRWYGVWSSPPVPSLIDRALTRIGAASLYFALQGLSHFSKTRLMLEDMWYRAARRHWRSRQTVAAGLFRGVRLSSPSNDLSLLPKLLGTYKFGLQKILAGLVVKRYSHVYFVGGDDGYLLAGMGTLFPDARLLAYNADSQSCGRAERNLRQAGMWDRSQILNRPFEWSDLEPSASRILMVCDMGGGELELFTDLRVSRRLPDDLIIEFHDSEGSEAEGRIISTLGSTHLIRIVPQSTPPLRWLDRYWGMPASAVPSFADEQLPTRVRWLAAHTRGH